MKIQPPCACFSLTVLSGYIHIDPRWGFYKDGSPSASFLALSFRFYFSSSIRRIAMLK
jgi:hypothetical protein